MKKKIYFHRNYKTFKMVYVIIENVPVHRTPADAINDLINNLDICNNILPIRIRFLQNNLSVQDAEVELGTINEKEELIKYCPFEYYFNGDPIPIEINIVESNKKMK